MKASRASFTQEMDGRIRSIMPPSGGKAIAYEEAENENDLSVWRKAPASSPVRGAKRGTAKRCRLF